jgi:photosystem II stability/assembly factor-like uncharacterized protein
MKINPFFTRTVLLTCFLLLSPFVISAQSQWHALPSAHLNTNGSRFDDVFFISDTVGWALNGSGATVYKTIDGGASWTLQLNEAMIGVMLGIPTPNYYFRNIEFLTPEIGFVGSLTNNRFFKTVDGGTTWSLVTNIVPAPRAICGLDAVGSSTVYGCGAYFGPAFIIKSTDSGATWQYINMSAYADALVEIHFLDENVGYASGQDETGGVVLKTFDGGATWTEVFNSNVQGEYVWKLQTFTSNPDIVFGSIESVAPTLGKLIKSTDAGVSWVTKNAPETDIQAVGFISETHGWMGGHNTGFYETFDAGDTWTNMNIGSNLNRIFIINDNLAYASGATIYKFDQTLGTGDFQEMARVPLKAVVQPNPIVDRLTIAIDFLEPDNLDLELYDGFGKKLTQLKNETIDKAGRKIYSFEFLYPKGIYYVNLHTNTGRQSVKVIK